MTRDGAVALHGELEDLLAMGPGGISDRQRDRLKQIRFKFDGEADPYLRTKADQACRYLEIWLSPRKWQQWGSDPDRFRAVVSGAVYGVRMAIDEVFPPPKGAA